LEQRKTSGIETMTQKFKETEIGMIPEEWNLCQFEDLFEVPLRNGLTRPKKMRGSGIKMVNMGELFSYERIFSNMETDKVPILEDEFEKFKLKKGDLLFARQSLVLEGAGRCSIIMDDIIPSTFESHIIRVRLNEKLADPLFYFYFYKSTVGRNIVSSIVEQVAAAGIRGSDLSKLSVLYPPIEEQKSIANVFSILDDKIELNNQMSKTLEQITQTLFKHWFIDFEFPDENGNPYKSSGGRMVDSELGEIPEGWEVKKIGNYLNTISKTYPLNTVSEVIFLNTGDIQNGRFLHSNKSTVETLPGQAKKSIQKDDILYSEIRPENKRFAYVFFDGKEYVVSTKLMVLRPIADIDSKFLYFILTQQDIIDFLQTMAESRSGTFPQITFNVLSQVEFCGPKDNKIIHMFSKSILAPFMQERYLKDEENIRLSNIRDSLLPKLMSGKIRVEC
jgi:type I restriction enzyme S subunit